MAKRSNLYKRDCSEMQKAAAKRERDAKCERDEKATVIAAEAFSRKQAEGPYASFLREKAPKLIGDTRLNYFTKLPQIRSINTWNPKTKSREGQFISLCEHLFAKYPTPSFLWSVFDTPQSRYYQPRIVEPYLDVNSQHWVKLILKIAQGESFYKMIQAGDFKVPLSRKGCHLFLSSKGGSLTHNVRTAQVLSLGGSKRLANTLCKATRIGREINFADPNLEKFFNEFIIWCINNPMLDHEKIDPLLDYVMRELRPRHANFSMIGRSANALIREMERWHRELRGERWKRSSVPEKFPSSNIKGFFKDRSKSQNGHIEVWRIDEILTASDLRSEGHRMRHCVYSYSSSIVSGKCSIWSLSVKRNDGVYSVVTIEVENATRRIVQARGPCNRMPEPKAKELIMDWARSSNLIYATY